MSTFSGNYLDLQNKPDIPSEVGDLSNNVGFITSGYLIYEHQKIISTGSTVEVLNKNNRSSTDIIVFVNGISFFPEDDYSVNGNILSFTESPSSGSKISIRYLPT